MQQITADVQLIQTVIQQADNIVVVSLAAGEFEPFHGGQRFVAYKYGGFIRDLQIN
ncbi:hypothetical protein D3C71_1728680 [compost metagenome]